MGNNPGISSMVKSSLFNTSTKEIHTDPARQPVVVTVSRSFGSNGGKIAELLAERLHVPCYGHSMIDELISKTHTTKKLMSLMDEKLPRPIDSFIYSLFVDPEQSISGYYKHLIKAVTSISREGGVIVGRGARLILAQYPYVFRVRIEGSRDVCIKRVAQREGVSLEAAKRKIAEIEQERSRFLKGLFKRYPNNRTYYDMVINSDKLEPQQAVEIIVTTMEKMGYPVPEGQHAPETRKPQPVTAPPHGKPQPYEINPAVGLKFLIVEDEAEFFAIINGWLANAAGGKESPLITPSLHLTHATSFKEAESFLALQKYDLILLDLNLSDSHGYDETFVRLNQKKLDTPIIVFTGLDDDQKAVQAVDDGAQDYLVKGQVNRKTLLRSIRQALSRYKIMRAYGRR
ncbi:MAG: response regulator [Magnetococcales bacterium]|nr:response regulator [Magnetococcales bacterium]